MDLSQFDFTCLRFKEYETPTTETIEINNAEADYGEVRRAVCIDISKTLETTFRTS